MWVKQVQFEFLLLRKVWFCYFAAPHTYAARDCINRKKLKKITNACYYLQNLKHKNISYSIDG